MAPVAMADVMGMVRHLDKIASLLKILDDKLPCLLCHHPPVLLRHILVERAIRIEEIDGLKAMALSAFEVIRIMGRRDLHHSRTESHIDKAVCDYRYAPVCQRQKKLLAYNILISLIVWIDSYSGISEHRLRTCRRDCYIPGAISIWIPYVVKLAGHILVLHLIISKGGAAFRAVVHKILSLVYEATLIKSHESFPYSPGQAFIHRESLMLPVT